MHRAHDVLLCELHAHTRWSDGLLTMTELVDLHGEAGFDVLCVTDHVVRGIHARHNVNVSNYDAYLDEIDVQAARAADRYGLLVVPGLELTYDDPDPAAAAHIVAVGLRRFVDVDDGIDSAAARARAAGAALIGAHPYDAAHVAEATRTTTRLASDRGWAEATVDRFELFNRNELFPWVAEAGLPAVACGDVHLAEHLRTWKTGLPCAANAGAIVELLRSRRPVHLVAPDVPAAVPVP